MSEKRRTAKRDQEEAREHARRHGKKRVRLNSVIEEPRVGVLNRDGLAAQNFIVRYVRADSVVTMVSVDGAGGGSLEYGRRVGDNTRLTGEIDTASMTNVELAALKRPRVPDMAPRKVMAEPEEWVVVQVAPDAVTAAKRAQVTKPFRQRTRRRMTPVGTKGMDVAKATA